MNASLKEIILRDEKVQATISYTSIGKNKDPTHYQRRKQQRAISEEMVLVCLTYGDKKRIRGAITYSLLDKNLIGSPYAKFIDILRGLRVVLDTKDDGELSIVTVYWLDKIKKNPKKKSLK